MLESLKVKNLALIEETEIEFKEGLNILTGETGAGKSILLGSVNLALGQRAEGEVIRSGESEAYVELVFSANDRVRETLRRMELDADEDQVIITRKITPQKSVFKINGETVLSKQVKELAGELIDIHGQHEHQSLLNTLRQRDMIDAYGGNEVKALLSEIGAVAGEYSKKLNELNEAKSLAGGRDREINLLEYEIKEIEDADLKEGEDEELEAEYKRMQSSERLIEGINEALNLVSGDTGLDAGALISRALNAVGRLASMDEEAGELSGRLSEAQEILGDFAIDASRYMDRLEYDPEHFKETEDRLNLVNTLKSKFGRTITDVLNYYEEKSTELEKLKNLDEYTEKLEAMVAELKARYLETARKLSEARKKAAARFGAELVEALKGMNFLDVKFDVNFDTDFSRVSSSGSDETEFMISTNPGEPLKAVRNVASGGELSRIMLGIKTILADRDDIDALIFDEIDTGISGVTAREVASRLKALSGKHQVILITHLAQIAAMADTHFLIEKGVKDGKTLTEIAPLNDEGEIKELARLLGGDETSEAALSNARELKALAQK